MKGSNFVFDYVDGLPYKCHTINLHRVRVYIISPVCIKYNKHISQQIQKTNVDKCFCCVITVALKHEIIGKDPQRTSKIVMIHYRSIKKEENKFSFLSKKLERI